MGLGVAAFAAIAEFFADKVMWLDSVWTRSQLRPTLGGALLALAIVDAGDPAMQAIAFLLGGGGALIAHGGKAGTRAVVNASPEPFSNVMVSAAEDIATAGLLALAYANPVIAGGIALVLLGVALWLLLLTRRVLRRVFGRRTAPPPA